MPDLLTDTVSLITGGSSGIGRGIATSFAREGADVVVADLRRDPKGGGQPTPALLREKYGVDAHFVECDVTELADLETAVAAADDLGGLDVMVNNAGIFHVEEFLEASPEEYDRVMDVNARGAYFGSQAAGRVMTAGDGGCIINLSSINSHLGNRGAVAYSMSKAAVQLLTRSLAGTLGPDGVRVNALHPGAIRTMIGAGVDIPQDVADGMDMDIPLGRRGDPADVGDAAVFLASDLARYVNGASLQVDGGMTVVT
jgi:NAD(P)-dependent dehydrogenase (short-subunit alcohol dehydrogenase family)